MGRIDKTKEKLKRVSCYIEPEQWQQLDLVKYHLNNKNIQESFRHIFNLGLEEFNTKLNKLPDIPEFEKDPNE